MQNMSSLKCYIALLLLGAAGFLSSGETTPQELKLIYAVNAGGDDHTDQNGIRYVSDPLHGVVGTASDYGKHLLIIGRVPEQDEILYRTERYHTKTFGYDLPIEGDGEYALILKFCEVYFNEPNMKVFDVVLNNRHTIVSELDIFHQVGRGTAHEEYAFFKIVNDRLYYKNEESLIRHGLIRLDFIKGDFDNPKINAFVLMKGDVTQIPRLSISDDILPMDADMAVFHDRVSADSNVPVGGPVVVQRRVKPRANIIAQEDEQDGDIEEEVDDEDLVENSQEFSEDGHLRKTSGPKQPYPVEDSSSLLPLFIAIGAFIPLLFCLCKL